MDSPFAFDTSNPFAAEEKEVPPFGLDMVSGARRTRRDEDVDVGVTSRRTADPTHSSRAHAPQTHTAVLTVPSPGKTEIEIEDSEEDMPQQRPGPRTPLAKVYAEICTYPCNGWLDYKYDSETFPPTLKGHVTYKKFQSIVEQLNTIRKKYRCNGTDYALLGASVGLLPMIPFMMRKKSRAIERRKEMKAVFAQFEYEHETLRMRIDKTTGNLIIETHPSVLYG
ncbi:hypothetical protein PTSG_00688 [Salpingoeca rosetta]|uniref:Uncharacterized protein n=1 Tax=Salpingoeca rosetta (strain ATCC 50818 / BSB-021) TaxID=946362 RepID=F2TX71_SALR5|nr:uncharacterized protein PTSG_00688 [Salpingoeca rosetta]EGD75980.1 hypothetical protein PTSG_00688 [Salpingoeca rosetta]|eukprot:XP_004998155.1 hypothetical protein PTSG_00688 [Salpingoeca rosetta]